VIADLLDGAGADDLGDQPKTNRWIDEQLVTVSPLSDAQSLELFQQRAALAGHPIPSLTRLRWLSRCAATCMAIRCIIRLPLRGYFMSRCR